MKRLICLLMIFILMLGLVACQNPDENVEEEPDEEATDQEPAFISVYLDNTAKWGVVYCYIINNEENGENTAKLMTADKYGIFTALIPADTKSIMFGNGEGERTEVLELPDNPTIRAYDNSSSAWMRYSDAIANEIGIGDNTIIVTDAHKSQGYEYLLFHADMDGEYIFDSDSDFVIKIVAVEFSLGNWDADSPNWTAFAPEGNRASLKVGDYYVCIDNSTNGVDQGVHRITLSYKPHSVDKYPLVNDIYTDGELTFCFMEKEGNTMVLIDGEGNSYSYSYSVIDEDGTYAVILRVMNGSADFAIDGVGLSVLSSMGKLYVLGDFLYVLNEGFELAN